jgi:hypothetical protein
MSACRDRSTERIAGSRALDRKDRDAMTTAAADLIGTAILSLLVLLIVRRRFGLR